MTQNQTVDRQMPHTDASSQEVGAGSRPRHPHIELMRSAGETLKNADQCSRAYEIAAFALYHAMTGSHREALDQLVKDGPVYDGNVVSKAHRDDLMTLGLATRVCYKGEQGYTAANYIGWDVLRAGTK